MSRREHVLIAAFALTALVTTGCLAHTAQCASTKDGPALLYFDSDYCVSCKKMTPLVDEIRCKYRRRVDVIHVNLDCDEGRRLARKYGIVGTPTLLLLDGEDHQVSVLRGTLPKSVIEQAVEELVARDAHHRAEQVRRRFSLDRPGRNLLASRSATTHLRGPSRRR